MTTADDEPCEECGGVGWSVFTEFGNWRPDEGVLAIQRCDSCLKYEDDMDAFRLPEAQAALRKAHEEEPDALWGFTAVVLAYIACESRDGKVSGEIPHPNSHKSWFRELAAHRPGFQQVDIHEALGELKARGLVTVDDLTGRIQLTYDW